MISSARQGNLFVTTLAVGAAAAAWLVSDHGVTPFDPIFESSARKWGVPSDLLRAVARVESSMRADTISAPNKNGTRDYGLCQINEHTAAGFGIPRERLLDPQLNVDAAARLFDANRKSLGERLSPVTWAAAYNVGADLEPHDTGVGYAQRVVYHWTLYNLGGLFRPAAVA